MIAHHESGTVYVMVSNCDCDCDTSWEAAGCVTVTVSNADCEANLQQARELLAAFDGEKKHLVERDDVRPAFPRAVDRLATGRNRDKPLQLPSTYG